MTSARIRFATDILRRLGEELNPSIDKGILELVKNSYDADAINCTVELKNVHSQGGSVTVKDDGLGMAITDIKDGWLVLGRSGKDPSKRTELGRFPAGSKGLGRLAALRMGHRALLTTRPAAGDASEHNLLIDWNDFSHTSLVEDVELSIETSSLLSKKKRQGTEIRIEGLRQSITSRQVQRLAREILLLAGPFGEDTTGFKPRLVAPEFSDMERLVSDKYFSEADYHLVAKVASDGYGSAEVLDWRGAVLFSASHGELADARKVPFKCPPLTFDLWQYKLEGASFSTKNVSLSDVKPWLRSFGGVHIYQNGLRVSPYGDPGNDWLDMNLSRTRSPEERPSTNNSIGRILLSDPVQILVQKTDRSGFLETDPFLEVRAFAQAALDWMAHRRLHEAELRREKARAEAPQVTAASKACLDQAVSKLPLSQREPIKKAVAQAWSSVDREINQYQQEIQLYRTLSTAGITSATFAHESSGNPIKVITQSIAAVHRRAEALLGKKYETSDLAKPVASIRSAIRGLAVLGTATLRLLIHEKRRLGKVDVHSVIKEVLNTFDPFLTDRGVDVKPLLCDGAPYLRGSNAALESVITNLINNSINAFERAATKKRIIEVRTLVIDKTVRITVADSGPGIEDISLRDIWLPGRTTRKNGTGLGLVIVRDTVKDLGGEVAAVAHGTLGGAEITVDLPIIGV